MKIYKKADHPLYSFFIHHQYHHRDSPPLSHISCYVLREVCSKKVLTAASSYTPLLLGATKMMNEGPKINVSFMN